MKIERSLLLSIHSWIRICPLGWSCFLMLCLVSVAAAAEPPAIGAPLVDLALQLPRVTVDFDLDAGQSARGAQGVPSIERSASGRLWAAWYAG